MAKLAKLNEYIEKIIVLKNAIGKNLMIIGGLLYEVRGNESYKEQCETFEEFLALPELSFSRATAFKAMKVYEIFVEKYSLLDKVSDIDPDKLYKITAMVNKGEDINKWIDKARSLSRSDLAAEVREVKGLPAKSYEEDPETLVEEFLLNNKHTDIKKALVAYEIWRRQ